jgi:hypothetical protein
MRAEKRAGGVPRFFDPPRAAERKDPLRGAFGLEVAPRESGCVFFEQVERSLGIATLDGEIGVAKKTNIELQRGGWAGGGEPVFRRHGAGRDRGCD